MTPIATENAPAAIGAYSQAVAHGGVVYCSGQIGLKPDGTWAGSDVKTQAEAALKNLDAILTAAAAVGRVVVAHRLHVRGPARTTEGPRWHAQMPGHTRTCSSRISLCCPMSCVPPPRQFSLHAHDQRCSPAWALAA